MCLVLPGKINNIQKRKTERIRKAVRRRRSRKQERKKERGEKERKSVK